MTDKMSPEPQAPAPSDFDGDPSHLVRTARSLDHDNPHPLYVVWEITLKCDLGCRHCGSRAGKARVRELTTDECLDVVRQLADLGVREVTLIGGEAYLRPDWHVIARAITDAKMACSMTSGARGLTQTRVDQAEAAGIRAISISIDGLEATHDAQRGVKGSWQSAVDASRRVGKSTMRLTTNTQINRLSMPELPAIADLLVDIGSRGWQLQLTVAMGRAADRPALLPQPYDLLELFPLLTWIKQEKLDPAGIQMFPGNNIGYFGPFEEVLRYGGQRGAHYTGCSAGKWTLGLEADGAIKGCPSLPTREYTGGNILDERIAKVVAESSQLRYVRERTVDDLWGYCRTCYYADACMGGCTWTSHCLLGKPGNNPYCIHRAMDLERQGKRERIVKVEAAPGIPFDNGRFELVVEPLIAGDATMLGVDLKDVLTLKAERRSVWDAAEIERRLEVKDRDEEEPTGQG